MTAVGSDDIERGGEPLRACLVGPGRAGGSLTLAWQAAGLLRVEAVLARSAPHPVAEQLRCGTYLSATEVPKVDLWLVATPDDTLEDVAAHIAQAQADRATGLAVHFAGSRSSSALKALRARGFSVASGHPMRSFPALDTALAFGQTWCALEGDPGGVACLDTLFSGLGGRCFAVDASAKTAYHGAASLAGNAIVALADAAIETWCAAGVPEATARALFADLAGGVVANVGASGSAQALSGPVSRGDLGTVAAHLSELDQRDPSAALIYRSLSTRLLDIAPGLDRDSADKLRKLLS